MIRVQQCRIRDRHHVAITDAAIGDQSLRKQRAAGGRSGCREAKAAGHMFGNTCRTQRHNLFGIRLIRIERQVESPPLENR